MKLGVVGKGGTGKTTVVALLARELVERGRRVVAIDTDSNPNLGLSLGLSPAQTEAVPVLPRSAIVGSGGFGESGDVGADDLVRQYGRDTPSGATLLSAIRVTEAGAGCTCGGHATVRSMLGDALAMDADVTLVDMEAGLEHLSRSGGTLAYADVLVVVVEPTRKAVLTAARTKQLADELGIRRVVAVGNKAREDDATYLEQALSEHGLELVGVLSHDPALAEADRAGEAAAPVASEAVRAEVHRMATLLEGVPA